MLVTSHVFAGAVLGRLLSSRRVGPLGRAGAFAAGVASHLLMDACPHWGTVSGERDDQFLRVARCDGCAALAAMALSAGLSPRHARTTVVAAMAGGAVVDMDKPLEYFFGWNPFPAWFNRFHRRIQNESPDRLPHEVATAGALAALAVLALRSG